MAMTANEKLIKKMDRKRLSLQNATKRYRTICQSVELSMRMTKLAMK
jgi:hypothetical protein